MIHFEEIDKDTDYGYLRVSEAQKGTVAEIPIILARAYLYRNYHSHAYLIRADKTPVGMALYYDYDNGKEYTLAELFIDERYQRRGYGTEAVKKLLEEMRADGRFQKVYLSYTRGNETARRLYEKFGFQEIVADDEEVGMELEL